MAKSDPREMLPLPEKEPTGRLIRSAGGGSVHVVFVWQHDRCAHQVWGGPTGQEILLLESVEGSDTENWPPSPPLQQLSTEVRPHDEWVALLVGMAGKSHWSVSIEPLANGCGFVFDVACRRAGEGPLASTYHMVAGELRRVETECHLIHDDCRVAIRALAVDHEPALLRAEAATCRLEPPLCGSAQTTTAQARTAQSTTIRWKYSIALETPPDRLCP